MPDGDRFEKTLHGKWWIKAYRQACAGDSFQMLGDTLMKAAADALRRQLACAALAKIRDAVYQALKEKARGGQLNFGDQPLADPFRMPTDLLSDIVSEEDMSLSTQLAAKVAQSVYLELQRDCRTVSLPQVQELLSEAFGRQVIRNQWLAKGREGLMLKSGRNFDAQMEWEDGLSAHLSKDLRKMIDGMFRTDGKISVRAPRRSTPQRKMTIEELHQGIAVLEV
jgi:hypothetical protein